MDDMTTRYSDCTAILFDAGHTLFAPTSGSWVLPPKYAEFFGEDLLRVKNDQPEQFSAALKNGLKFLDDNHLVKTEEEEYQQFLVFYRMVFEECGCAYTPSQIDGLTHEMIYDTTKFSWFDDVIPMLQQLGTRYTLGLVSDTWPSLETAFVAYGVRDCFSTFVMSSIYGVTKAETTLFEIALRELQVRPEQSIFVDDLEKNLNTAELAGVNPLRIDRYDSLTPDQSRYPIIRSLEDLPPLLA